MKRFALLTNYTKDPDLWYNNLVKQYIEDHHGICWVPVREEGFAEETPRYEEMAVPEDTECVIILGGDGTLLKIAGTRKFGDLPYFGINLGTMGFLTSAEAVELPYCLDDLLDDTYDLDERIMINGRVFRKKELIYECCALNDVVINRSGFSRLVEVRIHVNDEFVTTVDADGVIISTPTGSTGYNLSAGGPIVFPHSDVMIATPICPHSMMNRSIVVSGSETVRVEIGRRSKTQKEEAIATFDGNDACKLETGDVVEVKRSLRKARLIRQAGRGFYSILQNKISGA